MARVRGPPGRTVGGAGGGPSDGPPPTPSCRARRISLFSSKRLLRSAAEVRSTPAQSMQRAGVTLTALAPSHTRGALRSRTTPHAHRRTHTSTHDALSRPLMTPAHVHSWYLNTHYWPVLGRSPHTPQSGQPSPRSARLHPRIGAPPPGSYCPGSPRSGSRPLMTPAHVHSWYLNTQYGPCWVDIRIVCIVTR